MGTTNCIKEQKVSFKFKKMFIVYAVVYALMLLATIALLIAHLGGTIILDRFSLYMILICVLIILIPLFIISFNKISIGSLTLERNSVIISANTEDAKEEEAELNQIVENGNNQLTGMEIRKRIWKIFLEKKVYRKKSLIWIDKLKTLMIRSI